MQQHSPIEPSEAHGGFSLLCVIGVVLGLGMLLPASVAAQRESGTVGVGFQVGRPGGLSLKLYRPAPVAYDIVLSTDADDYVTSHLHRLRERSLPDSPLHYYAGPGLIVGFEGLSPFREVRLGLSGEVGLNFYAERFEVFLHVTPTLRFLPDTRVGLDGNVGLRYSLPAF